MDVCMVSSTTVVPVAERPAAVLEAAGVVFRPARGLA
jgi:hypothetical protein